MDIGGAQFEAGVVFGVVALLVTGSTGVIAGNLVHNFLHPYDRVPREASRPKKQEVPSAAPALRPQGRGSKPAL
jgi:hypothetical protein